MKKTLNILIIILLSPILLIGLLAYILLFPIERYRYYRSTFYKDTRIKYLFLITQSLLYKAYVVARKLDIAVNIIKDGPTGLAIEGSNHIYYQLDGTISYKDGWYYSSDAKTHINLDEQMDKLLTSEALKDQTKPITFLIDKNLIEKDEQFLLDTHKHPFIIINHIETLTTLLDTEQKITNTKDIHKSLPVYINRVVIAIILVIESIMLLISNQAIESLLRSVTVGALLIIPLSLSVISILSSGLFKKPYIHIKPALVERFITLLLFLVLLLAFFISDSGYYF